MRHRTRSNNAVITEMEDSDQSTNSCSQRRAHFRVPAASEAPLGLVVWKIPPHWFLRDRPKPSAQLRVELVDLSVGGMCLNVLPHRLGPEATAVGDRLRVEFTHNNEPAILDSQIVYRLGPKDDGSVRIGVAFQKLENTIEGRRAGSLLDRVIAGLQRQNIKQAAEASA
jgi:c-di-GMP-binding flagellar brake protein YcgR